MCRRPTATSTASFRLCGPAAVIPFSLGLCGSCFLATASLGLYDRWPPLCVARTLPPLVFPFRSFIRVPRDAIAAARPTAAGHVWFFLAEPALSLFLPCHVGCMGVWVRRVGRGGVVGGLVGSRGWVVAWRDGAEGSGMLVVVVRVRVWVWVRMWAG